MAECTNNFKWYCKNNDECKLKAHSGSRRVCGSFGWSEKPKAPLGITQTQTQAHIFRQKHKERSFQPDRVDLTENDTVALRLA